MSLAAHMRSSFRVFAEYTSVSGLGQIARSSHWTESLAWTALFLGSVVLTIYECSVPVTIHLQETTYTTTDLVRLPNLTFPGSSLCIEFDIGALPITNITRLKDSQSTHNFVNCLQTMRCRDTGSVLQNFQVCKKRLSHHHKYNCSDYVLSIYV